MPSRDASGILSQSFPRLGIPDSPYVLSTHIPYSISNLPSNSPSL